ncbi:TonB-dependent receptor, partial [Desulfosarcina sp.]|uniref:TonB-dependent receptor n=1 Tax=Desulfosarcina sp. TaxID=2027861 RepID=UPI0029B1609D
KLGMTWQPFARTTLRGAVFRVLTRTLLNDQTVEPTQVAGFNQFYQDTPGADIWTYGAAVDQRFSTDVYGGIEFVKRDLDIPFRVTALPSAPLEVHHTDWQENLGRGYLYWTPHPWIVGSTEYLYEHWDRGDELGGAERIQNLTTHRLRLGGSFFHPSGIFARLRATYADQEGTFWDSGLTSVSDDGDHFWVTDAALGYRFPKRYGMLTFEVKNLFDETFKFQDTDATNPSIYPERLALIRLTLSF